MEILFSSFGSVRSAANVRNVLFFLVGVCGVFQLVHGRHRDVDNVPYETALKYDSQLTSAEKSADDGKLHSCMWNQKKKHSNKKALNSFTTLLENIVFLYIVYNNTTYNVSACVKCMRIWCGMTAIVQPHDADTLHFHFDMLSIFSSYFLRILTLFYLLVFFLVVFYFFSFGYVPCVCGIILNEKQNVRI